MTRIFLPEIDLGAELVTITGRDSVHIASALRMRPGESLIICDGEGKDAVCIIKSAKADETVCEIVDIKPSPAELPVKTYIYQSLPKGDKFEFIIQKATELGVSGIIPVLSDRCISRPDGKAFEKKLIRYKDICREAAQQCGRGVIPQIFPLAGFKKAVCSLPDNAAGIFCYEKEKDTSLRRVLSGIIKGKEIHVFIGPEGGFSDAEKELADAAKLVSVTFGERILRCETAPVYVMSAISYEFG